MAIRGGFLAISLLMRDNDQYDSGEDGILPECRSCRLHRPYDARNKRNTVAVILAVIILILGIFAVGGSFWMQEHEIASGAQEYESMSESLKPDAETEQIRADEPDEIEKPTGDDLTGENEDTSETDLENFGAEIPGADIPMTLPLIQELPLDDNTDLNMDTDNQPATGNIVTNTTVADEPVDQMEQSITTGMTGADLAACKAMNKDFVGWLQIPGTDVDYPVVLTNDVDYYLDHTFTGTENVIGCLFSLDKTDYQAPSKNIAVYGHHMRRSRATTMFQPLHNYKDSSFYATHKTINYDNSFLYIIPSVGGFFLCMYKLELKLRCPEI